MSGPESDSNALPGAIPYPEEAEERFSLWRLCTCPECEGAGKIEDGNPHTVAPLLKRCGECRGEGRVRQELATAGSPEAVGVALVTLAREGEWVSDGDPCQFGLLDTTPECPECDGQGLVDIHSPVANFTATCTECKGSGIKPTGTWLVLPFPATARTASAAGRLLRTRRPDVFACNPDESGGVAD